MLKVGLVLGTALAVQGWMGGESVSRGAGKPAGANAHSRGGQVVMVRNHVEIQTIDDVVVRLKNPKDQYDDNGKIRRLTPEEYKAAKGSNPKLPGYQGDTADLKKGQILKLTLLKKKPDSKSTSGKDKDSDKPKETEWVAAGTANVVMEDYQDSEKTLTVGVDAATLSNTRYKTASTTNKKGKNKDKIVLDDYRVKMIEILTKDTPEDKKDKKK